MIIYKITNKINHKSYIGQTINSLKSRFSAHCSATSKSLISSAIRKYGKENFKIEVITEATSREELNKLEFDLITSNNTLIPNGYNLKIGGDNNSVYSLESKEKMSIKQIEVRKNNPHPLLGAVGKKSSRSKSILCVTNGIIYESGRQAAIALNLPRSHVNSCARGDKHRNSIKGYKFKYI